MSAYPDRPVVGVLAVLWKDGRVLLVQRANPPHQGDWGFPGGHQDLGETIAAAALRELAEETGLTGEAVESFTAVDAIDRDADGRVRYHYTLVAVLVEWRAGEAKAADDALAVAWLTPEQVGDPAYPLCPDVGAVVARAARLRAG
jgi:ADP-ribose pyrophosphatase YjhB (NUDIX family)